MMEVFANAKSIRFWEDLRLGNDYYLAEAETAGWVYHQFIPKQSTLYGFIHDCPKHFLSSSLKQETVIEKETEPVSIWPLLHKLSLSSLIILIGLVSGWCTSVTPIFLSCRYGLPGSLPLQLCGYLSCIL